MTISQRKAGVVLSYIYTLTNALVGFIYVPLLIHFLGQKEFGLYQLMGSFLVYLGLFDFGLSNTVTRYYSKYIALDDEEGKENLLALSSLIYLILTLILILVGIFIFFYLDDIFGNSLSLYELKTAKKMFIIILINVAITVSTAVFNSIITAHEKFIFLKVLSIIQVIIRPIIVLAVFAIEASAISVVIVQAGINIFGSIMKIYYSFSKLSVKIKFHYFDKPLLKEFIQYSFYIFITMLMDQIYWRSDQVILGIILGTTSVAVFSIGSQIVTYYMTLSTSMSGVFLPNITKKVFSDGTNDELSNILIKVGRIQYILLGMVLTGFILYGREFIAIWVGEEFNKSYYIALIIMIPFTIDLIQNIGLAILQAKNMYSFRAIVFLSLAISKIIISIPMAIYMGEIGAALATGVSYFIGNGIVMNYYYHKKVKLNILKFWKEIFKLTIPIILSFLIGLVVNKLNVDYNLLSLIVKIILYMIIYILIIWRFGMNRYEKGLLLNPIKKIYLKLARDS